MQNHVIYMMYTDEYLWIMTVIAARMMMAIEIITRIVMVMVLLMVLLRMKQTKVGKPSLPSRERSHCRSQSSCKLSALSEF